MMVSLHAYDKAPSPAGEADYHQPVTVDFLRKNLLYAGFYQFYRFIFVLLKPYLFRLKKAGNL